MSSTKNQIVAKVFKKAPASTTNKRKQTRQCPPPPEPADLLSPTSTAHSLTPPPPSPSKRRKISSPSYAFSDPSPTRPPASRFRHICKPINPKLMVDNVAVIKEVIRGGRSMSPTGNENTSLGGPSSSMTLIGEEDGLEEEEPAFVPETLPWMVQRLDAQPALLVKCQRNWFPAYLTGFKPVMTRAEKEAKQRDIWEVEAHPATGLRGVRSMKRENIMYLDDERLADCVLGEIDTQERQFLSDARTRSRSPLPSNPPSPLPLPETFSHLDRIDQFRLLRPHLSDVVNERYTPAQPRIDRFYAQLGGRQKSDLIKHIKYGDISEDEAVNVFIPELERWALRGCRPESDDPNPPDGSTRYNSLTLPHKRQFVQSVLQPEIIIRICISSYNLSDLIPSSPPSHTTNQTPSETELYRLAQRKLGDLATESPEKLWARIINEIQMARAGHRKRKGLPEENLSAYEKEQALLRSGGMTTGWASGRTRRAVGYWQGDGKQRVSYRPKEGI